MKKFSGRPATPALFLCAATPSMFWAKPMTLALSGDRKLRSVASPKNVVGYVPTPPAEIGVPVAYARMIGSGEVPLPAPKYAKLFALPAIPEALLAIRLA